LVRSTPDWTIGGFPSALCRRWNMWRRTRFGEAPIALVTRTTQADDAWLTAMLRRAATASSLEELVG